MTLFRQKYRVESTRLRDWDYGTAGWYFVTICAGRQACFFGDITDGEMRLSAMGEIVAEEWQRTRDVRPYLELDEWVIMPNHLHGIIIIKNAPPVETPRWGVSGPPDTSKAASLGSIVGQFKSVSTKRIWAAAHRDFSWQPRFYDHIIRDEASLSSIREYILNNHLKWELDKYHPNATPFQPLVAESQIPKRHNRSATP